MSNSGGSFIRRVVAQEVQTALAKLLREKNLSNSNINQNGLVGCLNADRTKVKFNNGQEYPVTVVGNPTQCCFVQEISPGHYLAVGPKPQFTHIDGGKTSIMLCAIFPNNEQPPFSATGFKGLAVKRLNSDTLYWIDVQTAIGQPVSVVNGFDMRDPQTGDLTGVTVEFSPSGKHLIIAGYRGEANNTNYLQAPNTPACTLYWSIIKNFRVLKAENYYYIDVSSAETGSYAFTKNLFPDPGAPAQLEFFESVEVPGSCGIDVFEYNKLGDPTVQEEYFLICPNFDVNFGIITKELNDEIELDFIAGQWYRGFRSSILYRASHYVAKGGLSTPCDTEFEGTATWIDSNRYDYVITANGVPIEAGTNILGEEAVLSADLPQFDVGVYSFGAGHVVIWGAESFYEKYGQFAVLNLINSPTPVIQTTSEGTFISNIEKEEDGTLLHFTLEENEFTPPIASGNYSLGTFPGSFYDGIRPGFKSNNIGTVTNFSSTTGALFSYYKPYSNLTEIPLVGQQYAYIFDDYTIALDELGGTPTIEMFRDPSIIPSEGVVVGDDYPLFIFPTSPTKTKTVYSVIVYDGEVSPSTFLGTDVMLKSYTFDPETNILTSGTKVRGKRITNYDPFTTTFDIFDIKI